LAQVLTREACRNQIGPWKRIETSNVAFDCDLESLSQHCCCGRIPFAKHFNAMPGIMKTQLNTTDPGEESNCAE
jgi:hypothetical protein